MKFDVGYALRAIVNEFHLGDDDRWVNVRKEHQQLTNLLETIIQYEYEGETP